MFGTVNISGILIQEQYLFMAAELLLI